MLSKLEELLDQETRESTDRILEACDIVEADMIHVITSRCVEPYGRIGEKLFLKRCQLSDLKQYDLIWLRQKNETEFHLAYAGVVSVSEPAAWVYACNANPFNGSTRYVCDIAELYRCVAKR